MQAWASLLLGAAARRPDGRMNGAAAVVAAACRNRRRESATARESFAGVMRVSFGRIFGEGNHRHTALSSLCQYFPVSFFSRRFSAPVAALERSDSVAGRSS
jgi:hypothetical protein